VGSRCAWRLITEIERASDVKSVSRARKMEKVSMKDNCLREMAISSELLFRGGREQITHLLN